MKHIKTWSERCEEHPDHQERIITERMIQARMQEEIDELRRLHDECPSCEYHKNRAARWRAEAYKHAGHDKIELPWVGLTDDEIEHIADSEWEEAFVRMIEAKLKEKNT
jgi:hypothetical protein